MFKPWDPTLWFTGGVEWWAVTVFPQTLSYQPYSLHKTFILKLIRLLVLNKQVELKRCSWVCCEAVRWNIHCLFSKITVKSFKNSKGTGYNCYFWICKLIETQVTPAVNMSDLWDPTCCVCVFVWMNVNSVCASLEDHCSELMFGEPVSAQLYKYWLTIILQPVRMSVYLNVWSTALYTFPNDRKIVLFAKLH